MNLFPLSLCIWTLKLPKIQNRSVNRESKSVMLKLNMDGYRDKDSFIGLQEFVIGYSKAPKQPQSSARHICHSHTLTSTGREPATIRITAYRSSPHYALRGRRLLSIDRHTYSNGSVTFNQCCLLFVGAIDDEDTCICERKYTQSPQLRS